MKLNKKYAIYGIFVVIVIIASSMYANQVNEPEKQFLTNSSNFPLGAEEIYKFNSLGGVTDNMNFQADNYNISQWQSFFDNKFANVMNSLNIPGMALSVVNSTNMLINKGYGYASLETDKTVNPDTTIFRLGSISKVITWTAVMQLYEKGLLDFDVDVNTYLSAFKIKKKFKQPITMKHLITHSAGFEADWIWNGDATEETLLPLEDYIIQFQPRRVSPPGETCSYSNYGAGLAAYIVTQISGLDYDTYIEENIFNPLKMNSSTFRQPFPEHLKDNFTSVYSFDENGDPVLSYSKYVLDPPAGGLASTALDMAQFMMTHLNNGMLNSVQILQENTSQQMKQRLFANDPRISGWTYGWVDTSFYGVRILHHGGAVARSGGIIFLLPGKDLGIFLSYNTESVISTVDILASFLDRFFTLEPVTQLYTSVANKEKWKRFEGKYMQAGVWETTPLKIERVIDYLEVKIDDDGYLLFKDMKFVEIDDLLFRVHNADWYIAFRENENGKITYLMQGGFTQVPYKKANGVANPTNAWVHMILCLSLLLIIGLELPIRIIIEKFRKKERKQDTKQSFVSRSTYLLSVSTSFAYVGQFILMFIVLFVDFGTNKQNVLALNIIAFLPILIIPFSGLLLISTISAWIKKEGSLKNKILASSNLIITSFHLWFIFFWNFIGFLFNYGVWIPYLG